MCLAVPGKIETIEGADLARAGRVDFGGVKREVNLSVLPEARVGDYVLVHAGLAISRVDEDEAARVLRTLEELEEPLDFQEPEDHERPGGAA